MKRTLWKDFFREILKSKSRFISIFAIVFIGVAFFSGIKATAPDMKYSMDKYYDQYNLMDIRIMSTLGLTDKDIEAIGKTEGVLDVQAGYFTDVVSTINSSEMVIKVHSIPSVESDDLINNFRITEGRYPSKEGECVLEDLSIMDLGLEIGDKIKVSSGKEEDIKDGVLKVDEFTIVGKAKTPYYLSYEKGPSDIGSGKVNFFIMILEDDFIYPVYTEALATVEGAKELNSYSKKYEKLVSKSVIQLENIGVDRSALRLDEIKSAALAELNKAKEEFNREKERFDREIKEAEDTLNQAQVELVEGEAKLEAERKNFETNYNQAKNQIADGERRLASAEKEYSAAQKEYNDTMAKYGGYIDKMDSATKQINSQKSEADSKLIELRERAKDPNISEEEREETNRLIKEYETLYSLVDRGVNSINDINDLGQGQVKNAQSQLSNARKELDSQSAQLKKAKKDLEAGKSTAYGKFASAEREIKEGKKKYELGKAEFDEKRIEGQKKLDEGREKIIKAENEIERISNPQWHVLDRNMHYSFVDYGKTADRIDAIAKIFPVFFFLVASLVCLTTMTRMVDEQRSTIGIYKALGYNNRNIASKYVLYAIFASVLGGALGLYVGIRVFPKVIYESWAMMYTLPKFEHVEQIPLMLVSLLVGVLVTTISAWGACHNELKETPSLLLRPKAPKAGKEILLEKIKFIWNRLTFSHKVTARNLFRYKKRFFMTIIGIAGCSALLLAGFGLRDSIAQVVDKQFNEIFTHDISMKLSPSSDEGDYERVIKEMEDNQYIESFTMGSEFNAKVKNKGEEIAVSLIIPSEEEEFKDFISLRNRSSKEAIEIPESGVVLNEKLAKELKVSHGDAIEIDNGNGVRKKIEVADITENYVFHYAYMSQEYYSEIFRIKPKLNNAMIKLSEANDEIESSVGSSLMSSPGVASVTFFSSAEDTMEDTVTIMNNIVIIIIASAGLLAFVVLYNLTNINISERIREIATIKVLGFYNREVASYVYRENTLLSIIGSLIGILGGIGLHRTIMLAIEQDGVMFGYHIEYLSFVYAFLITMVFVSLVNIFMYPRLKHIPMVESLKSVE